jgi:iron complex outermembrane receptor protein
MHLRSYLSTCVATVAAATASTFAYAVPNGDVGALKQLSIEDLMDVEVTSVSKGAQAVGDAPAAIFVITADDIRGSGATSIAEVLRLAPNLQVLQLGPSNYTITARGFSGSSAAQSYSNKLLVLIDGRSVYTPLFSGVYWDSQDTLLDDVERIEVISGPGAALWGANAVNGVINITTRSAAQTTGGLANASVGSSEKSAALRWGGAIGAEGGYRVYVKGYDRDTFELDDGTDAGDGYKSTQAGFRTDWQAAGGSFTVQGDYMRGEQEQPVGPDLDVRGSNVLARWQRRFSETSELSVQVYYDHVQHSFDLDTYDVSLQHSFKLGTRNSIVWGLGHRSSHYAIIDTPNFFFVPNHDTLDLSNIFAQDIIDLGAADLTLGIKFEHDDFQGTTPLPNLRFSWKAAEHHLLWAAASRAIRSSTPFDRDVQEILGSQLFLVGNKDFKPEKLTAYELGYRGELKPAASLSVTAYYHVYDDLRSIEFEPNGFVIPLHWGNSMEGDTYGVELWGNYQVTDAWRMTLGLQRQHESLRFEPGASGLLGIAQNWNEPTNRASLHSLLVLPRGLSFDADLRYQGALPDPAIPAYTELNARLGWRIGDRWEMSLAGANLLHAHHKEFTTPPSDRIERRVLLGASIRF